MKEEKEFDFSLTFHGYTPVIEEEYTGYYIKLLVYKDEYYERWCTKYFWNFDTDEKFCDEYGNELDDSELPPGFEEAFEESMRADSDLGNFEKENSTTITMKTNSLYLNNIFLEPLSYFGKPNKRFKSSTIIGIESFFNVSCEYTKENWKGEKKKHLLTIELHWYKDSLILHAMTTDRDSIRQFGTTHIDMRDKEADIKWDIISFCELNEIKFK